jgi:hypothetical protein
MAFQYGEREMQRKCKGPDVEELQIRLAGFRGTVPDGDFGPGTERQVMTFQQDFMEVPPTGVADRATLRAIDGFSRRFPIDFKALKCRCGVCKGFGRRRFRGEYRPGMPRVEAFHRYEYPGVHRMLLWAVRAAFFYLPQHKFVISSGYRCAVDNKQHGRSSTNHHGKAIDLDVPLKPGESKRDDMRKCDAIRGVLVERAHAQIAWDAANRKALEPSHIAPTWVHYDVRCYESKYLQDRMFCTTLKQLDNRLPVRF